MTYTWNIEDYKLMKERKNKTIRWKNEVKFDDVYRFTDAEKIEFVDSVTEGKLTKIINAVDAYNADTTIKKDEWGYPKNNSLNAWVKRNKFEDIIDTRFRPGEFTIFGMTRSLWNANKKFNYDNFVNLINEAFNRTLHHLADEERKYFNTHDPYIVTMNEVIHNPYVGFIIDVGYSTKGEIWVEENEERRYLTLEDMNKILAKANEVKAYAEKVKAEFKF